MSYNHLMKRQSSNQATSRTTLERDSLLRARQLVDRMRSLYRELESHTGAPVVMHRAVAAIAAEPGIPASRLAELLGLQRSTMSHVLKALAARAWIERRRSEADQRSVRLHITAAGRNVLQATTGKVSGVLQRAVRALDENELAELNRSLEALLRHIDVPQPVNRTRARETSHE